MAASNLIRWGGPAAILGGVLCFFGAFSQITIGCTPRCGLLASLS